MREQCKAPCEGRDDHQSSRDPGQDEKLGAFVRRYADFISILVDDRGSLDSYSSCYGTGNTDRDER